MWNDFAWEDLGPEYVAIKWHRHPDEPEYDYHAPRCREFLEKVRARGLPILLEESFENTLFFLEKLAPDQPVIIPHLGALSGGYGALKQAGVWSRDQIWADMAVAGLPEIEDYLQRYGSEPPDVRQRLPFQPPGHGTGEDHGPGPAGGPNPGHFGEQFQTPVPDKVRYVFWCLFPV